ncbi:SET and MYND domain-containing protein 4 [Diachasma alloeum]|uniref:SET and MYND domain-containing protein 4 n=1 Tax=Diachasma alloeum TaxID=454923 RepID=UPI0007382F69|nr:SET and MYND domain-containing protein 4 [Diachasma alloeum]
MATSVSNTDEKNYLPSPEDQEALQEHFARIREWLNAHRDLSYPDVFSPVYSDEDRIRLTIAILAEHGLLGLRTAPQEPPYTFEKDLGFSQLQGSSAEVLLKNHKSSKHNSVIDLCTQAIIHAPVDSKELAIAYGRRAEALLRVKLYEDCLKDVERAVKLAYPPDLMAKLMLIKTRALASLYDLDSIIVEKAIEETKALAKQMNGYRRGPITHALNQIVSGKVKRADQFVKWNDEGHLPDFPPGHVDNPEIPGASDAIAIRYSGKYGRHIVATRDIDVGEVLAVQIPYAAVLELERRRTNCWYCLMQTWSAIPCDACVNVVFCSEECRDNAWREFHDVECGVLGLIIAEKMDVTAVMSARLLIKGWREAGSWQALRERVEEVESYSDLRTKGFTSNILDSKKYTSIITLSTCTEKRSMEDLFRLSVGATTLVYVLATMTNIFGEKLAGERNILLNHPWVIFAGSIILKHAQIHSVNSQMACEWDPKANTSWARAMVLVPIYGLINHSCDPSVNYTSHGRYMALHTIRPIKKGEQIFDHRGASFASVPYAQRQLQRRQLFFFMCDCLPCQEAWPQFNDLPSYSEMGLPKSVVDTLDNVMCSHNVFNIMQSRSTLDNSSVTPLSLVVLIENLKDLYKHVHQPCREIEEVVRTLENVWLQIGSRCQSLDR